MRKIARFGYKPDLGDPRDHVYQRSGTTAASVDLRSKMPPVWDQGNLGSCVWHAIPALISFHLPQFMGSRLWGYYKTRVLEHTRTQDAGCELRDAIKVLAKLGFPPEKDWPYIISRFRLSPPRKVTKEAKTEIIQSYERLNGLDDYRDCLASGFPFAVGISVFDSFESDVVASSGKVPMPAKNEQMIGGHAICVVGYQSDGSFLCRNSWGLGWGLGGSGYFILPEAYLASADLATDSWMIRACPQ